MTQMNARQMIVGRAGPARNILIRSSEVFYCTYNTGRLVEKPDLTLVSSSYRLSGLSLSVLLLASSYN